MAVSCDEGAWALPRSMNIRVISTDMGLRSCVKVTRRDASRRGVSHAKSPRYGRSGPYVSTCTEASCDTLYISHGPERAHDASSRYDSPAFRSDTKDRTRVTTSCPFDHLPRTEPPGPHAPVVRARHYEIVVQIDSDRSDQIGVTLE
jgi:hypothetical protein